MTAEYLQLLDATVEHLRHLRAAGARHVEVRADLLAELSRPPERQAAPSSRSPARPTPAPPHLASTPVPAPPATLVRPRAPEPDRSEESTTPNSLRQEAFQSTPPGAAGATVDRAQAIEAIRERALVCQKCPHLVRSRTQVVFGVGNLEAEIMFVGEAPGADEDRQGEPFVGRAGQLLTRIIGAMNLSRDRVYIANILKCRPDVAPGAYGNRPPRPEEMETCKPYVVSQIEIIQPKVIVALGATAVLGLLGVKSSMSSVRGRWQQFRGIPVMPTFHPSYLLRAEDGPDRGHAEKRKTWEDMLQVLERLQHPVTDRMRGFFLKPPA